MNNHQASASSRTRTALPPLACAEGSDGGYKKHQPRTRHKREQVYNACLRCKLRKTKCTGTAPCSNCVKEKVECVFNGRSHERVRQNLVEAEKNLAATRQELITTQHALSISQGQASDSQQGVDLAHGEVLGLQQQVRDQAAALENIFANLRLSNFFVDMRLQGLAMQCRDAQEFSQKMSFLSPYAINGINKDDAALSPNDDDALDSPNSASTSQHTEITENTTPSQSNSAPPMSNPVPTQSNSIQTQSHSAESGWLDAPFPGSNDQTFWQMPTETNWSMTGVEFPGFEMRDGAIKPEANGVHMLSAVPPAEHGSYSQ